MTTTNPRSFKRIVGINFGEKVCADHAPASAVHHTPEMGICYACAAIYGEPKREALAKRAMKAGK